MALPDVNIQGSLAVSIAGLAIGTTGTGDSAGTSDYPFSRQTPVIPIVVRFLCSQSGPRAGHEEEEDQGPE